MKRFILILVAAVSCGASALASRVADPADKKPSREELDKRKEDWKKLTPEEREAKRIEIKTRLETRITELRIKRTNETITAQESRELSRSEQVLKRFEQNGPGPARERVLTNGPAAPEPSK
jgi:hypothetical protein